MALLLIFIVLPIVLVGPVIWYVSWRNRDDQPAMLTSEVLATGEPARAEIIAMKAYGGFLDARPMVRFSLRVDGRDVDTTQSVPRDILRTLAPGMQVDVRITTDRAHVAVVM